MVGHSIKIVYFITILGIANPELGVLPVWIYFAVIPVAYFGTSLPRQYLAKISDHQFRNWTQGVTLVIGVVFLVRGVMLFMGAEA